MPYGVWALNTIYKRQNKINKRAESVANVLNSAKALTADGIRSSMVDSMKERYAGSSLGTTGLGAYHLGKALRAFNKGRVANALKDRAISAIRGQGGYIGTGGMGAYYNNMFNPSTDIGFAGNAADETGCVTFSNREYLGDIKSTTSFDNVLFTLNPGLSSCFPFLSQIAANYQCYQFMQLGFEFKSLLSEATNSGAIGQIMMVGNINPTEPALKTAQNFLNRINAVAATPTNDIVCGIECDPGKLANTTSGGKYVRVGSVPGGHTQDQYDWGTFQIATNGMPTTGETQGQLWVEYTVKLYQPILFDTLGKGIIGDAFRFTNVHDTPMWNSDSVMASPNNTLGVTLQASGVVGGDARLRITFPEDALFKIFQIRLSIQSPIVNGVAGWRGTTTSIPSFTNFTNCTQQQQITAGYTSLESVDGVSGAIHLSGLNCLGQQNQGININGQPIMYNEASQFGCTVLLDGVYGTESYVDFFWKMTIPGYVPALTFEAAQMILTVTQVKPDFVTVDVPSKYYADWIPVTIF